MKNLRNREGPAYYSAAKEAKVKVVDAVTPVETCGSHIKQHMSFLVEGSPPVLSGKVLYCVTVKTGLESESVQSFTKDSSQQQDDRRISYPCINILNAPRKAKPAAGNPGSE